MGRSDVISRALVALPLAIGACLLVGVGGWWFVLGVTVIGFLCLHELFGLLDKDRPLRLAAFAAMVGVAVGAHAGGAPAVLGLSWAALLVAFLLVSLRADLSGATASISATMLGVVWIVMAIGFAILLRDLNHGGAIVLDTLIATFAMDTGSYFAGRSFGRTPLAPRMSPKKTVEGLVGGVAAAIVAMLAASLYQSWLGFESALLIALVAALLGPLGDLFESVIKRDAGAKDASTVLGPHGGLLDRIDGVLFSIVGVYWLWSLIA